VVVFASAALGEELRRVPALVHVHSDRSTGENSYAELVAGARRKGVEALLLTEEQLLRIEYSLPPFRALTRVVHEERSVFVIAVGLLALVRGWPFTVDPYPWWEPAGMRPAQAIIDEVDRLGGVTMWSFPEAYDEGRRRIGPITVGWRTDAHSDDLLRSVRYTA